MSNLQLETDEHGYIRVVDSQGKRRYILVDMPDCPYYGKIKLEEGDEKEYFSASDSKEIVRCEECIHRGEKKNATGFYQCNRYDRWQPEEYRVHMPPDGFCSYGHRRTE